MATPRAHMYILELCIRVWENVQQRYTCYVRYSICNLFCFTVEQSSLTAASASRCLWVPSCIDYGQTDGWVLGARFQELNPAAMIQQ